MNETNSERRSQVLLGLSRVVRDEAEGNTSETEKDWLRRICGGQPMTEQKIAPTKEAEHKPVVEKKAKGHGFGDIAGMNELKEFVTEGFTNVLNNRKCAKVYIDQTLKSITASCDFFYTDMESLKNNVEHVLNILGMVRSAYHKAKFELM